MCGNYLGLSLSEKGTILNFKCEFVVSTKFMFPDRIASCMHPHMHVLDPLANQIPGFLPGSETAFNKVSLPQNPDILQTILILYQTRLSWFTSSFLISSLQS